MIFTTRFQHREMCNLRNGENVKEESSEKKSVSNLRRRIRVDEKNRHISPVPCRYIQNAPSPPTPSGVTITQSLSHVHTHHSFAIHSYTLVYPRVHTIGSEPKLVLHRRHRQHPGTTTTTTTTIATTTITTTTITTTTTAITFSTTHRQCPSLAKSRIPAQQRPAPTSHCVSDAREYRREKSGEEGGEARRRWRTGEIDIAWVDVQSSPAQRNRPSSSSPVRRGRSGRSSELSLSSFYKSESTMERSTRVDFALGEA
ncbi:uncharacterized protein LOC120359721 [Solenopsis invicta]|uniref:uncharacterized protein LOC120359721 n=1 Tax=Solenopsis invicta TaxID=13686 RepID=UPI00193E06B0|nr:uncharacterized protein LOC120359721 [Solenopsis invicta]